MRDLAPIILDMFIYRIKSLLIIRFILLWPPPSQTGAPLPPSCFPQGQARWRVGAPQSLPTLPEPWHPALHHCPRSAWMLVPETHASTSHPLFPPRGPWPPDLAALVGQTSWPAQVAPQVDTLLTGFRSLHSHPRGQTDCEIQEERPPSQQVPYWRGWGRRGRILGSGPPVLKLLLLLLPFCSGCWRFWSPVNWNVMNSSDHYQPVQCVRGIMYSEQFLAKISQDLGSCMMFLQKVSLESGTRKKNWVLLR